MTAIGPNFPDVLAAARTGAAWAFHVLYDAVSPAVAGYARGQRLDVDDLTSEVFLAAFTGLHRFDGDEASFRAWVLTIAHHKAVDEMRRRSRRPEVLTAAPPDPRGGDVEAEAMNRLGDARVLAVLEKLLPEQRAVLLLRVVGDLSVEQVAEALGKSPGAVKALQRRALAAVRKNLEREGVPL